MAVLLLSACGGHLYHRVERGETLYSIGWVYGYDYRQLARWNDIEAPYVLSPGQRLRVAPPSGQAYTPADDERASAHAEQETAAPASGKTPAPVINAGEMTTTVVDKSSYLHNDKPSTGVHDGQSVIDAAKTAVKKLFNQPSAEQSLAEQSHPQNNNPTWRWPTKDRRVLSTFSANNPSKQGLDIAGELGDPVFAAAAGRVVYAGSGLVQYGRLIIIKHNEKFLSAFAHNQKLHVKEGDVIQGGQRIAEMGRSGNLGSHFINAQRAKLHFEIRRNGEPVDPIRYLPK